jgi:hypothetical protein
MLCMGAQLLFIRRLSLIYPRVGIVCKLYARPNAKTNETIFKRLNLISQSLQYPE